MSGENDGQNPQGQSGADNAQATAQGAKDATNLAKNAASGNYLGAAKDAINLAKNKKFRKRMLINAIMPILSAILIVSIAASLVLGIFNAVGDAVQSVLENITSIFGIEPHKNNGVIEISNDAIDEIIKGIEDLGISLDDLHLMGDAADYTDPDVQEKNKEALRKYIREFYEAQMVTQTIYTTPSWYQKISGEVYGTVYIQRTKEDDQDLSEVTQLEYISYEEMQNRVASQDTSVKQCFSIDDDNKLVVTNSIQTTVEVNGKETTDETTIGMEHIDYKSVISQYTTSMNFFLYLTIITQNPEFVTAVADLVKDSDIRITIMDNVSTNITVEERNYTVNTKTREKVEYQYYDAWDTERQYPYTAYRYETSYGIPQDKTEITKTTITTTTPVPAVTYAKTWFSEQTIEYNRKDTPRTEEPYSTKPINEKEPEITGEGTASWITNDVTTVTKTGNISEYVETLRGDVIDKTGEKGDGKKSFIGLLDVQFKIPNSTVRESAGGNLVSGAEMFFYLLQKDANSQNLENVMRYILYKYTGNDYGVTELDFSVFETRDFITVGRNGGIEEILKSYENEELRKYMNKESANYSSVSNYVTQDRTQYKMYYTSFDGCLNFSYGIMVRNKKGKLNNEAYFAMEGLNLQELVNRYDSGQEVLVDVEILDRIFRQIVKDKKDNIKNILEEKGVSLKTNQLDALVNVAYQYGNCGQYISDENNIAELYKTYYEKGNTETFKQKAVAQTDNGNLAHFFTGSEYSERKQYNWILFNEGRYILSNGEEISASSSGVVEFAQQLIGENHSRFTSYNPTNGVSDVWSGANWCAMFVSYCYNECGLIPNVLQEPYAGCTTEVNNLKARGEFIEASTGYIPQPGDIVFFTKTNGKTFYHTGIVKSCDGTTVYTIEGNTGNSSTNPYWKGSKVAEDSYSITDIRLGGYFSINGN